jgi:hypothetical protein
VGRAFVPRQRSSAVTPVMMPGDNDLLSILIDDALAGHDPHTVVSLHTAPTDLDPFAEATIRLANPAFGAFLNSRDVLAMAAKHLDELRNAWLNPPDLIDIVPEVVPGHPPAVAAAYG